MKLLPCIFALSFSACSLQPPSGPVAGKAYFVQAGCASCHRVGREGSATGPDLTLVGLRHSDKWLDVWLSDPQGWKPGTLMPNKRLSPLARAAIISYLMTLKGQDWSRGGRPWDAQSDPVARGRLIFTRAGCAACHGRGGAGGSPNNNVAGGMIPALAKVSETYSKPELIAKIKRGVTAPIKKDPQGPDPLVIMPSWSGVLDDDELEAVASYLMSLKSGKVESTDW